MIASSSNGIEVYSIGNPTPLQALSSFPEGFYDISKDGKMILYQTSLTEISIGKIVKKDNYRVEVVATADLGPRPVVKGYISEGCKYAFVFQRASDGSGANAVVLDMKGKKISFFNGPKTDEPLVKSIKLNTDESLIFACSQRELSIRSPISMKEISTFELPKDIGSRIPIGIEVGRCGPSLRVVVIRLDKKEKVPYLTFVDVDKATSEPIFKIAKTIRLPFCDDVEFKRLNNFVLVKCIIAQDRHNKVYGGTSSIYVVNISKMNYFQAYVASDNGPIHDFIALESSTEYGWPSDVLVTIAGFTTGITEVRFTDMQKNKEIGYIKPSIKANTLQISQDRKLLILGGFGALPGGVEVFTLSFTGMTKIAANPVAQFNSFSTSYLRLSPDSSTLLLPTVTPNLRVDNRIKLLSVAGEAKFGDPIPFKNLYSCRFIPDPDAEPVITKFTPESIKPQGKYIPPHMRSRMGGTIGATVAKK